MSKNVKVNGNIHNGISVVELVLADGSGKVQFKDVDEISEPTGTKTITTNGTHDVKNYASAIVNVPTSGGGITPSGTKEITANGEYDVTNYAKVNVQVASSGGSGYSLDDIATGAIGGEITLTTTGTILPGGFSNNPRITKVIIDGASVVDGGAFSRCEKLTEVEFLKGTKVSGSAFYDSKALKTVRFHANTTYISTGAFSSCIGLTDIYVPWSESDVIENVTTTAPWNATNATIHYNSV